MACPLLRAPTMKRFSYSASLFALCFAVPTIAAAQPSEPAPTPPPPTPVEEPVPPPPPAPVVVTETVTVAPAPVAVYESTEPKHYPFDLEGFGLAVGGGVSDFTNERLRDTTGMGGEWDARLTWGTRSRAALELSYIGSAQTIDALGLGEDAFLVSHGGQAALRLNALPASMNTPITPFIFGGVAWRHYSITNTDTNTSDVNDSDNVFEVPVGVGLSTRASGFLVDLRGEYRWSMDNELLPNVSDNDDLNFKDDAAMHRWGVALTVGVEI